jgi:hypothetical protein
MQTSKLLHMQASKKNTWTNAYMTKGNAKQQTKQRQRSKKQNYKLSKVYNKMQSANQAQEHTHTKKRS